MGRGKAEASLPLFSLPIVPRMILFSPASLRHKEASAEESYKAILQKYTVSSL